MAIDQLRNVLSRPVPLTQIRTSDFARFVFNSFFDNQLNTSTENWVGTGRAGALVMSLRLTGWPMLVEG